MSENAKKEKRRIDPATTIIPFVIVLVLCAFFVLIHSTC